MDRRSFMRTAGTAGLGTAAAGALAAPALAQAEPVIRWRMASAFPRSSATAYGGGEAMARMVREATDGRFDITVSPETEVSPGKTATNGVADGTVEMAHTSASYSSGLDPTFALGGAVPFMFNARGLNAWLTGGGGSDLLNDGFFNDRGLHYLPGGATGAQMGGWFKREIKSVQDMKGLKLRIAGLGADVMARLGVETKAIGVTDLHAALEDGRLDAAEWSGPHDDEALGFVRIAPYYYYPGWWEGSLALCFFVARDRYLSLPPAYRSLLSTAAKAVTTEMLAAYDTLNPPALKRLVEAGAQLRPYPQDILNACFDASAAVFSEISRANAPFAKIHAAMLAFRNETFLYQQISEYTFDTFMMIKQREGALAVKGG